MPLIPRSFVPTSMTPAEMLPDVEVFSTSGSPSIGAPTGAGSASGSPPSFGGSGSGPIGALTGAGGAIVIASVSGIGLVTLGSIAMLGAGIATAPSYPATGTPSVGGLASSGGNAAFTPAVAIAAVPPQVVLPNLLAQPQDFLSLVPNTTLSTQALINLLTAATSACNSYTGRTLNATLFHEVHSPGRTRRINLKQYPIFGVLGRVATEFDAPLQIQCVNPAATRANVSYLTTGEGDGYSQVGILLRKVINGIRTSDQIYWSQLQPPTVATLASWINGLAPHWKAVANPSISPGGFPLSTWALADLAEDATSHGALGPGQACQLGAYIRDLDASIVNRATGQIEILEIRPESYRFPDRTWGWYWVGGADGRYGGVVVNYMAGYGVDALYGANNDLVQAAIIVAKAMLETSVHPGSTESERWEDYEWRQPKGGALSIPPAAQLILNRYRRKRLYSGGV